MQIAKISALATLTILSSSAYAVDSSFSGFAQLTVGRALSGNSDSPIPYQLNAKPGYSYQCPCFTGNYEYAGVYEYHKTDLRPESLAGVQGNFKFTPELSATVQLVARGADSSVNADWAYGSYKISDSLTLQVGRKRLPLYYYSDYMYVGYAYPWLRPSQDLYAWQIYSYDGANLLYTNNVGDWTYTGNVWIGRRKTSDNELLGNLYYSTRIDESWKKMIGGYIDASNDIFSLRGVYMHTVVERYAVVNGVRSLVMTGQNGDFVNDVGQAFYGVSLNMDYKNWLLRSEINYINRPSVKNTYTAQSYSGGYKMDKHTFMISWSQFQERAAYWPDGTEKHDTTSLSYRWDYTTSQALKVQFDKINDKSKFQFTGDAKLLSASWQIVF
ncbi:hypothetical protein [Duganella violaceipulchra]|uniref:Porin n=1 Tax=Duganella violaceipulchra TaxID=2849652 RepID=A0AA41HCA9_9BURK|nr:hypothetical protein [Duganella violaceicalia]MBV6322009.1 hypothetical protein [Duganella violaceicalia]MCP2006994.1 hypothetical protein [Duganella violaceicalia]